MIALRHARPDVVVLDYALARGDGLSACFRLKQGPDRRASSSTPPTSTRLGGARNAGPSRRDRLQERARRRLLTAIDAVAAGERGSHAGSEAIEAASSDSTQRTSRSSGCCSPGCGSTTSRPRSASLHPRCAPARCASSARCRRRTAGMATRRQIQPRRGVDSLSARCPSPDPRDSVSRALVAACPATARDRAEQRLRLGLERVLVHLCAVLAAPLRGRLRHGPHAHGELIKRLLDVGQGDREAWHRVRAACLLAEFVGRALQPACGGGDLAERDECVWEHAPIVAVGLRSAMGSRPHQRSVGVTIPPALDPISRRALLRAPVADPASRSAARARRARGESRSASARHGRACRASRGRSRGGARRSSC